jgi:hypothetical protein
MHDRTDAAAPRLLHTREAGVFLGLSPRTLEKFRVTGGGPAYRKLGRRVVYAPDDLQRWADQGTRTSTSDPGPQPGRATRREEDGR